jgi:hypothetical protein
VDGYRSATGSQYRRAQESRLPLVVSATIAVPNPVMLLAQLFGGVETWRRWQARKTPEAREFHRVRPATRAAVAAVYLGLAAALAGGMDATFVERDFDDV